MSVAANGDGGDGGDGGDVATSAGLVVMALEGRNGCGDFMKISKSGACLLADQGSELSIRANLGRVS